MCGLVERAQQTLVGLARATDEGGGYRLGLPMVVCVECLPADKPRDVVSVTRRSSGVAPWACMRVYARVLVPLNLYIHTYMLLGRPASVLLDDDAHLSQPCDALVAFRRVYPGDF